MANIIIGKVAPTFKGEWDSTVTYNRLDIVSYNGSSYGCVVESVSGSLPTDETKWVLVASKGDIGGLDAQAQAIISSMQEQIENNTSECVRISDEVNEIEVTKQDILKLEDDFLVDIDILEDESITWIHGTIIGNGGNLYTGNYAGSISDYIPVKSTQILKFLGKGYNSGVCVVGYDKDKNKVKNLSSAVTDNPIYINIDENIKYIRICYWDDVTNKIAQLVTLRTLLINDCDNRFKGKLNYFDGHSKAANPSGGYFDQMGTGTPFIDVSKRCSVYTNAYNVGNVLGIACYDKDKKFIGSHPDCLGRPNIKRYDFPIELNGVEVSYIICGNYTNPKVCYVDKYEDNGLAEINHLLERKQDKEVYFECSVSVTPYNSSQSVTQESNNTFICTTNESTSLCLFKIENTSEKYEDESTLYVIEATLLECSNNETSVLGLYNNQIINKVVGLNQTVIHYCKDNTGTYLDSNNYVSVEQNTKWKFVIYPIIFKKEFLSYLLNKSIQFALTPFNKIDWINVCKTKQFNYSNFTDLSLRASKINNRIAEYYPNGVYVAFGDSITAGTNGGYVPLIADYFDLTFQNLGVSGSSPTGNSNLSDSMLAKIDTNVFLCTISGGQNSWTTASDINTTDRNNSIGAINYTIDYLRNINPSVIILLAPTRTNTTMYDDYRRIAENKKVGLIPTDDETIINWELDKQHKKLRYDNIHFTALGNYRFAACAINEIKKYLY